MNDVALSAVAWLLTFVAHSTLLVGAAWLLERTRLAHATTVRETLWRLALVGALATATAQSLDLARPLSDFRAAAIAPRSDRIATTPVAALQPSFGQGVVADTPSTPPTAGAAPAAPSATTPAETTSREPRSSTGPSRRAVVPPARFAARLVPVVFAIWIAGALFALLRLALAFLAARRELSGRHSAPPAVREELEALAATGGLRVPRLTLAPTLGGPVSLPRHEIVLPPWAVTELDVPQRRALLAHELAHQARRDPLRLAATHLLAALLWPQPLLRLARRRLTELAELRADAWAAEAVGDPRPLAECLTECAARLVAGPTLRYAAGLASGMGATGRRSPLLVRIDRLLEGGIMTTRRPAPRSPRIAPLPSLAALAALAFVLPGCSLEALRAEMGGGTSVSISSDDDAFKVSITEPGYRLRMQAEGTLAFRDDESDVATLSSGGTFRLQESTGGVTRIYEVSSSSTGLERRFRVDGTERPFDDEGRAWLAAALPRLFRESGFDAEARVGRLLARGGADLVLAEAELCRGDFCRGGYLRGLFARSPLDDARFERAAAAMATMGSDFELRRTLDAALADGIPSAERFTRLADLAAKLDSDFEKSEFLRPALDRLPDDATARSAWLAAARTIDSDFERGRTVGEALERGIGDAAFSAELVRLLAATTESDFELRQGIARAAARLREPVVAAAYVDATRRLDSGFERSQALIDLLDRSELGEDTIAAALDSAAEIEGGVERARVLVAAAPSVVGRTDLTRRYREAARGLDDFSRGQALAALDDASPR